VQIIVLNVHAPRDDKSDKVEDNFYKETGHVFNQFPRYNMKILLGDFNTKIGILDIFKSTVGNGKST
jgi:hypothetical protein